MKQKTALQHFISELEKIESKVITTENAIFLAKSLLPLEKDQLVDMGNRYHNNLKTMGIKVMKGEDMFKQVFEDNNKTT